MNLGNNTFLQGGKYKIVRFISSGGFGCTYEGELVLLHKRVAIKEFFVKDFCNRDEQTSHVTVGTLSKLKLVERLQNKFLEEAGSLYSMQHQNIVRVTDVFEENGTAYYVMDYVDGESLQQKVKNEGALTETIALKYIRQIADALKYVHGLNRLHLDIKPGNIMVNSMDNAILIDFGASKQYDEVDGENTSTLLGKTPGYAPIEQMSNNVKQFTPATDIYSLGATLYKLLTGNTPPDATVIFNEGLDALPGSISKSTNDAVMKAMELRVKNRPQTIDDFLLLLGSVTSGTIVEPRGTHAKNVEFYDEETIVAQDEAVVEVNSHEREFNVNGVKFKMIKVEAGTFTMGATSEMKDPRDDEKPTHQVTLTNDYYIGKTEVTQALWKAVMGNNPSEFKGDNLPVETVSRNDCYKFIDKLNSMTGQNFRLPTEAEWEFAARGGNNSNHYQYSGSNNLDDVAWYGGNSGDKTHTVATKQPNELGIYDMSGNVWEWCSDRYGNYSSISQTNPTGPNSGSGRVIRGGSWLNDARGCRSSNRYFITPAYGYYYLGLRLVLVP